LGRPLTPEEKAKWEANLVERYNIRRQGKPKGEAEEKRARQIINEEKERTAGGVNWQHGGRVRDRLKPRGEGQNEPKPAEEAAEGQAAARPVNRRRVPPAGGAVRDAVVNLPSVPRDAERAMVIKDALASGEQKDTGHKVGGGVTGSHPVVSVEKPGGEKVAAVRKNKDANALQEEFAADFIHAIGGHNIMPVVARDDEGAALMEYVNGEVAHDAGVYDARSLKAQLTQAYAKEGMSRDEAVKAAERDVNLMQVADYLLANDDRHGANYMLNDKGKLQLIDNGLVGRGDDKIYLSRAGAKPTRPRLRAVSQGGSYNTVNKGKVLPEIREAVGKLSREDVLRMAGNLQGSKGSDAEIAMLYRALSNAKEYRDYIASEAYVDAIWARIEHIRDNGYFEYKGI
jgi:hypothetical protein